MSHDSQHNATEAKEGEATQPPTSGERYYYRSLTALSPSPDYLEQIAREFPPDITELAISPVNRRSFLGAMGASFALAGVSLSGCIRKPKEEILPYTERPEFLIPGKPRHFATSMQVGGCVLGLLVESQEGRPTKIEGNPKHPMSLGATSAWAQASVLGLYDPDRCQAPRKKGTVRKEKKAANISATERTALWNEFNTALATQIAEWEQKNGKGLALFTEWRPSPTYQDLLAQFQKRFPQSRVFMHDAAWPNQAVRGLESIGLTGVTPFYKLEHADVVVALDADFLGNEGDTVRNAAMFAQKRRVSSQNDSMNRLYAIDPALTVTSSTADHRFPMKASRVGAFLKALASHLVQKGLTLPSGAESLVGALGGASDAAFSKWVQAIADDLLSHRGKSLLIAGERQPAWVHALTHLLNTSLENAGKTVELVPHGLTAFSDCDAFAQALQKKEIDSLVIMGGNPAYDAPRDLKLGELIAAVPNCIRYSPSHDETADVASWHVPATHYLEAWGDFKANDGTCSIQQPLIAPLYDGVSDIEFLAKLAGSSTTRGYELVKAYWKKSRAPIAPSAEYERTWRKWLHDGVIESASTTPSDAASQPTGEWSALAQALNAASSAKEGMELDLQWSSSVFDGRFANNGWLQELPDPITKLTWDNAVLVGPKTASKLGVEAENLVELSVNGQKLTAAVWITPGVAEDCVVMSMGYGRSSAGSVGSQVGFDAGVFYSAASGLITLNISVSKASGTYKLASTQDYGTLVEPITGKKRPILREATLEEYRQKPDFVIAGEMLPKERIKSPFVEPHPWKKEDGPKYQQWGLSIDLNTCTGCNACLTACQSENNVPVVGKERILNGREMHWIRMDRYFSGSPDDPQVAMQPLPCQQCENAPCETVCPVAATAHSPEGLNDMAYNRCIGTRYCANNCPYKVRRFNYFNFQKENDEQNPLLAMQRNPDVTVRFRGTMEKCTYCVQRINEARITAKREHGGVIPDGEIKTACQQACPSQAIVFGDVSDPNSAVSKAKAQNRDYTLLAELNNKPRTTYLAKLRNPNPKLV